MSNFGFDYQGQGGNDMGSGGGGGGGFGGSSQPSPGRQRRDYGAQTLIPCTIRMVNNSRKNAEDNTALPDGRELHQVKIVGAVRSFEDSSTKVLYIIEDGTGLIEVNKWIDDNDNAAMAEFRQQAMQDHVYVRVIGAVKEYDGKKSIVAYSIRKVSNMNELTYHMLEAVYSAERYKRGNSIVAAGASMSYSTNSAAGVGFNSGPTAKPAMGMAPSAAGGAANGSPVQGLVLKFFQDNGDQSDEGCSIHQCINAVRPNGFNDQEIRKAVADLAAEGEIYSTINEDTYKCAQ